MGYAVSGGIVVGWSASVARLAFPFCFSRPGDWDVLTMGHASEAEC